MATLTIPHFALHYLNYLSIPYITLPGMLTYRTCLTFSHRIPDLSRSGLTYSYLTFPHLA